MKSKALTYHENPAGKIGTSLLKPCATQEDLSLAYSPGVAEPCLAIQEDPENVYKYTNKGNLVAVISNGTSVLGLGDIGPLASKPVMEGKALLLKKFAQLDSFDLELQASDPDLFIQSVQVLEPSFGGILLEDIKAPDCFYIEEQLLKKLSIPVFHDDQHGTAIVLSAALLNATSLLNKKLENLKIVFLGAGAAALASAHLFLALGIKKEQLFVVDSQGLITHNRMVNSYKAFFAQESSPKDLKEVIKGADVFVGCSTGNLLTPEMFLSMNSPIVFALANPTPEIDPNLALSLNSKTLIGTGRSDYPNQINNLLVFPYLFKKLLQERTQVTTETKLYFARKLAQLAQEDVPQEILSIYNLKELHFGQNYLLPKPFDLRLREYF